MKTFLEQLKLIKEWYVYNNTYMQVQSNEPQNIWLYLTKVLGVMLNNILNNCCY